MIRIPRKAAVPYQYAWRDDPDPKRMGMDEWTVEELTDGQAADLIGRQRRQIADLKEQIEKSAWERDSLAHRLTREVDEKYSILEEMRSLRKKLKAEERAERAKAHVLVPIRSRRHIES